jgi:peptidoglycan hydrolase-like protein with peptidoglycan-binding domain
MAATYRTVQTALNRIGYGPVPVDGTANKATLDAIRGFELDNGLSVSGEPSDALIQRLVAIGAIKLN